MTVLATTGGRAQLFRGRLRRLTVGVLVALLTFSLQDMGVVPALPTAVRELRGLSAFGWAFSAFTLAWVVGTTVGGLHADARGPRRPMAWGLFGFAAGLLVAGSARDLGQFLAGRALQGAGGGAMISSVFVAIARGYTDEQRPRMTALCSSVWILPALGGPVISGLVSQWLGWRFVFFGIVPFVLGAAVLALPVLRKFDVERGRIDFTQIARACAVATGTGVVIASPASGSSVICVLVAVVGIAILAPPFRALLPRGTLLAQPGLPAGVAARGLITFSFFGTEAFIPLGSNMLHGTLPGQAGLALTAGALGWISAAWIQERLEASGGPGWRPAQMRAGFLVLAVGIAWVGVALAAAPTLLLLLPGWALAGAGIGLSYSAGSLVCTAAAPTAREGEVSVQLQIAEALSVAAAAGLGGTILAGRERAGLSAAQALGTIFAVMAATAVLGAAIAGRVAGEVRRAAPAPHKVGANALDREEIAG